MVAVEIEILDHTTRTISHGRVEPLGLAQGIFQHLHTFYVFQVGFGLCAQDRLLLGQDTLAIIGMLVEQVEQPRAQTGRGFMTGHQQDIDVRDNLLFAEHIALWIFRMNK